MVERVFFQTNVRTAMATGQAGGLALVVAADAGCEVAQYTSNEVKQAVVGFGSASKEQVQNMVAALLELPQRPSPPDVADALALAVCHLTSQPLRRAIAAANVGAAAVIGWLSGSVIARTGEGELLVDVHGVGYRVSVPAPLLVTAGEPGSEVSLHVHTHVREDAIILYGFATSEERRCFEALFVGPRCGSITGARRALFAAADRSGPGRARRGPRCAVRCSRGRAQDGGPVGSRSPLPPRAAGIRRPQPARGDEHRHGRAPRRGAGGAGRARLRPR